MKKTNSINLILLFLCLISLIIIFFFFSYLQNKNITKIIEKILKSEKSEVSYTIINDNHENVTILPNKLFNEFQIIGDPIHNQYVSQEYLILKLNFKNCKKNSISPLVSYAFSENSSNKRLDFSRRLFVKKDQLSSSQIISFPIYYTKKDDHDGFFRSIKFQKNEFECFDKIYQIKNNLDININSFSYFGTKSPELLLFKRNNFQIGNFDYNNVKKKFNSNFENISKNQINYSYKDSIKLKKPWKFLFHSERSCELNNCSFPNSCKKNRKSVLIEGTPEQVCSIDNDIVVTKKIYMNNKNYIYISGNLIAGQIKLNIFNEKNFFRNIKINKKGKFETIIKIPFDDKFRFSISNNINLYNYSENHFYINDLKIFSLN